MRKQWLERLFETVADRGRELLHVQAGKEYGDTVGSWCQKLLIGRGEASSIAIARDILQYYAGLDDSGRIGFFDMLYWSFGPEVERIRNSADKFLDTRDDQTLIDLMRAVEPPRQELFRRLNMAPYGTRALVRMRADLIRLSSDRPHLRLVDADLRHLLSSWFNRGFLRLRRIEWRSPAHVLEKLIDYESVHEITGWPDLRRRMAPDRRCFAFFHPALSDEPLIFVAVALVKGVAATITPLIDQNSPIADPAEADTAMFYSINNTQRGLAGISFGNFLIKQVLVDLQQELPSLTTFATLSPAPRFAEALRDVANKRPPAGFDEQVVRVVLSQRADLPRELSEAEDPCVALYRALEIDGGELEPRFLEVLSALLLMYLTRARRRDGSLYDPVAEFHLANGAQIERINTAADLSAAGRRRSWGLMVNYRYDPETVVANHEAFVNSGMIAMSKRLTKDCQKIRAQLDKKSG